MKSRSAILSSLLFITLLTTISPVLAHCAYSAYVDFGPAMTNGNLNHKERVYRSSGLVKNVRSPDPGKNYFAAYTSYRQTKVGEFELINIGPFDSEVVAYAELQQTISRMEGKGYKPKTNTHTMPGVMISNKKPC
jgi:hypothetical protein